MRRVASALACLLALALPSLALAQANVVEPQQAGQNQVRWDRFDWRFIDLLEGEEKGAGIRLYFYEGEQEVAERAAAAIVEEYDHLVEVFGYEPKERIPYILYDSHQELEETNLFQIGEGTLGVTSPLDLRMTASYWGDHRRFRHVSLHEMAHQFTIQKVNSVAGGSKVSGSPLMEMPLWFIEGIAEYYSTPGHFGPDDEWWIRDLVANPEPERGWFLRSFFDDDVRSFVFTYKVGQARIAFLTDTYGEDVPQTILDESYRMAKPEGGLFSGRRREDRKAIAFEKLLERVTGDSKSRISQRWEDWLKKRYYAEYLAATQQPSDMRREDAIHGMPDSFRVAPEGNAVVYRTVEPVTGVTSLILVDPRDASSAIRIASDGQPGVDSLHYFDRPVATLSAKKIAWIARAGANDVVHVGRWKQTQRDRERSGELKIDSRLSVDDFRKFDPSGRGIRELGSPAFSPDAKQIAFIALDTDGIVDIWTLDLESAKWKRVTNDLYAERELDWGEPGIAFSSDATPWSNYDLFLVDPATGERLRVRPSDAEHRHPRFRPGTSRLLYSGDESGKWDVYEVDVAAPANAGPGVTSENASDIERVPTAGSDPAPAAEPALVQRTDFATGMTHPQLAGDRLWGLAFVGGRFRVYSLPADSTMETTPLALSTDADTRPAWSIPSRELPGSVAYKPWNTGNWSMEQAFVAIGAGNGIFGGGFLFFQDMFRDRTVVVQGQAYGDVSLTDLQVVYFDRSRRVPLGFGVFMAPGFVQDPEFSTDTRPIYFIERKFGALALADYPLNRYLRIGTGLGVSTTSREVPVWLDNFATEDERTEWASRNGGWAAQLDATANAGYDTLIRTWGTPPLGGSSVVATVSGYHVPARGTTYGDATLDAQKYVRIGSSTSLGFRATTGRAFGDEWRRPFFVYSSDNLRGVPWYRYDYLISDAYVVGQSELAVPLDRIIRIAFFNGMIGIAGVDAGSVFDRYDQAEGQSTAATVLGVNMQLAIFDLRLHFARPFDIGGLVPGETRGEDGRVIVPDGWVTNFSIRYAWF